MLKAQFIFVASIFFGLSAFAAYEIETQGALVIIKKDGTIVKSVQQSANQEKLKTIASLIGNIKEIEKNTPGTAALILEMGWEDTAAETVASAQKDINNFEEAIETNIKLLN